MRGRAIVQRRALVAARTIFRKPMMATFRVMRFHSARCYSITVRRVDVGRGLGAAAISRRRARVDASGMDRSRYRRKVLLDLFASPWTLLPGVLGASSLLAGWAFDGGASWWLLGGIAGILAGAGAAATRWVFSADRIMHEAFDSLQEETRRQQEQKLDALDRRLLGDNDPRPEQFLRELRAMYRGFRDDAAWTGRLGERSAFEIAGKVEKLFQACIISLERSQDLWDTAARMKTEAARRNVLAGRERLLEEIRESVQQVAHTIDGVQSLALEQPSDQNLAQIRRELDESLAVARRVEERMQTLEAELGRTIDKEVAN